MKIVNLTPHEIVLFPPDDGGEDVNDPIVVIPPSGTVARCSANTEQIGFVEDDETDGYRIPLTHTVLGDLEGLPPPQDGTVYICSLLAATAAAKLGRRDVVVPAEAVRDDAGRIIGCRSLGVVS